MSSIRVAMSNAPSPRPQADAPESSGRKATRSVAPVGEVMRGARIVVECLIREGVDVIFGYPGRRDHARVRRAAQAALAHPHILVRHEQGAAHAAEGYARATGKVGVCMATSGPGATNLVTGLTNAIIDSMPLVAITGQVAIEVHRQRRLPGNGYRRHHPADRTKHNYLVMDVNDLAETIKEAFYIARSGRPGPVLVDIPKDVTANEYPFVWPESVDIQSYKPTVKGHPLQVKKAVDLIQKTEKVVLYIGGGVVNAGAAGEMLELAERLNLPVTPTLMAPRMMVPPGHPQALGMLGMHGTYTANIAMHEAELIINIGARFDDRVTGAVEHFARKAQKIHVDVDPSSVNKSVKVDLPIVGDAKVVTRQLIDALPPGPPPERASWWARLRDLQKDHPLRFREKGDAIMPQRVLVELADLTQGRYICSTDVGQHQMWAAQYYPADSPRKWLTSGGLGTMGYGLPAAMGAAMGHPGETVLCISGDGSFQMCIQELATCVHEGLDVKIIILNNNFLGMVRQWQELFYSRRYSEVGMKYFPDFVKIAEAYGATGLRAEKPSEVRAVLEKGLATKGTVVMDIIVSKEANVYPMMPAGAAHYEIQEDPMVDSPSPEPRELA